MGRLLLSLPICCYLNDVRVCYGIVSYKLVIQNKLHNWFKNVDFSEWNLKTAVESTCDLHHVCPSSWHSNSNWTDFHEISFLELYWNVLFWWKLHKCNVTYLMDDLCLFLISCCGQSVTETDCSLWGTYWGGGYCNCSRLFSVKCELKLKKEYRINHD